MSEFTKQEILEALHGLLAMRSRIEAGELGWDALADFFTADATFVDPAWGRIDGRDAIRAFFVKSMEGLEDWTFPHEWELVEGSRVVTFWQNRLPGRRPDGGFWQAPGVSRMTYAGDGRFCFEQDLLNMAHVFELMKQSGWKPAKKLHPPPQPPPRLCAWEP